MKRETYIKRLVTSYKNLSESEQETFRLETNLFRNDTTYKLSEL